MGVIFTVCATFQKFEFISEFKVIEREKATKRNKRDTGRRNRGINNGKKRCSSGQEFFLMQKILMQEGQCKQDKKKST